MDETGFLQILRHWALQYGSSAAGNMSLEKGAMRDNTSLPWCVALRLAPAIPPASCGTIKKSRGSFLKKKGLVRIKGTPDGWSTADIFLEWVKNVFVPKVQPLHTPHKCVVLLLDGSKTHLSLEATKELQALGVKVVVFPPHLTDVIQPMSKAAFRSLKNSFRKHEGK